MEQTPPVYKTSINTNNLTTRILRDQRDSFMKRMPGSSFFGYCNCVGARHASPLYPNHLIWAAAAVPVDQQRGQVGRPRHEDDGCAGGQVEEERQQQPAGGEDQAEARGQPDDVFHVIQVQRSDRRGDG